MICKRIRLSSARAAALAAGALLLGAVLPAAAQVVPSAEQGGFPIVVGAGYSGFNIDWGQDAFGQVRYMEGVTLWIDWNLTRLHHPSLLSGLGVEVEGRDINYGLPASLSNAELHDTGTNMRQDTGLGGVIYHWRHYAKVRPYGKALAGLGSIDFPPLPASPPTYRHDNRTITAFGAGADVHAWRSVWLRADWEYQFWPGLFGSPHDLTPTGITIGAVYDFNGVRRR
jgi:opacity protein-like surface antigen